MRKLSASLFAVAMAAVTLVGCDNDGMSAGGGSLDNLTDSASYAIGIQIGQGLKTDNDRDSLGINYDLVKAGMQDALNGGARKLDSAAVMACLMSFQQEQMQKSQERTTAQAAGNKEQGRAFLEQNKSKEGVKTTASGLQYIVREEGSGPSPKPTDIVSVNYRGTLIDGTVFDESKPGTPVEFPVNQVIKGWTEALQMMKKGAKWTLYIPDSLAYGDTPAGGGKIGPGSTLIFDVELLDVKAPPAQTGGQ